MMDGSTTAARITRILHQHPGERIAADELLPLVYQELRDLAHARVARLRPGQTIRATELVHEAWLKIVAGGDPGWEGRGHFFGAAANAMRNILVDQARRRTAQKRDTARKDVLPTDVPELHADLPYEDVITVHEALNELEQQHPRPAQVVLLRFFGGLTMPEIAATLQTSVPTIERDWRFARAWLQDLIGPPESAEDG